MGDSGGRKAKALKTILSQYDSDKDLSKEEQDKIKYSRHPDKEREKLWGKKGMWDKTKKMMKSAYYGDKRSK